MKVLFATPYYPPEIGAAQIRIHELAVQLTKLGHSVSVLTTFPNYPSGIVPREWQGKLFSKDANQGIVAYRIWSYASANRGFLKRIAAHLSFAFFATLAALFLPQQDAIIVESPPLFDGFIGAIISLLKRTSYLLTVSDLWPESAIQMGMLKNSLLIRGSRWLELLFYRRASTVLTLTAGIQRKIMASGIEASKVLLFLNSVDCVFFRPELGAGQIRAELGIGSEFLVLYAGTFGLAQGLMTVLQAAAMLQDDGRRDVRFVLAGSGAEDNILRAMAREMHLRNVTFVPPMPKERMPELINAADCVLVPLRDLEIFRGALPTKLFEAMACAKPVILGIAGEAEELVHAAKAGYCVKPESPAAICEAVMELKNDPRQAALLGANGREYVVRYFSRERRALELSSSLEKAAYQRHGSQRASTGCS